MEIDDSDTEMSRLNKIFGLVEGKLVNIQKLAGEPGQNANLELRLEKYALLTTENYNGGTRSNEFGLVSRDYRSALILLETSKGLLEKESVNKGDIFDSVHEEIVTATNYWLGRSEMYHIVRWLVSKYHLLSNGFKFLDNDFEELKPLYELKNNLRVELPVKPVI